MLDFWQEIETDIYTARDISLGTRPGGQWLPIVAHVADLKPCAENRVGSRNISRRPAHRHLAEHGFPVWNGAELADRVRVAVFSPSLAVHLDVGSKLTGEFLRGMPTASANNLLACFYVNAIVGFVRDTLGGEEFEVVLPALRPLVNPDHLPSSRWHLKGLFREVRPGSLPKICRVASVGLI